MMDYAKILKKCRRFRGVTQADLARRAGVSKHTVWIIENNKGGTTVETFEILLNALGFELTIVPKYNKADWRMP